jgi:hypothetical protein
MNQEMKNPAPVARCGVRRSDRVGTLINFEDSPRESQIQHPPQQRADASGRAPCSDILAEFLRCDYLSPEVRAALSREGVDLDSICRRRVQQIALTDPPRQAHVVYLPENCFEFAAYEPGAPNTLALVVVARDHIGDPIDLAAWSGGERRPALWCARASMLGAENLFRPRMSDGLVVHPTPLRWLRSGCNGVVILDEAKAAPLLREAEPLQADSVAHGQYLRRILRVPPTRILVPGPVRGGRHD